MRYYKNGVVKEDKLCAGLAVNISREATAPIHSHCDYVIGNRSREEKIQIGIAHEKQEIDRCSNNHKQKISSCRQILALTVAARSDLTVHKLIRHNNPPCIIIFTLYHHYSTRIKKSKYKKCDQHQKNQYRSHLFQLFINYVDANILLSATVYGEDNVG